MYSLLLLGISLLLPEVAGLWRVNVFFCRKPLVVWSLYIRNKENLYCWIWSVTMYVPEFPSSGSMQDIHGKKARSSGIPTSCGWGHSLLSADRGPMSRRTLPEVPDMSHIYSWFPVTSFCSCGFHLHTGQCLCLYRMNPPVQPGCETFGIMKHHC